MDTARRYGLRGILYLVLGILLAVALVGYAPEQCPWISTLALDRSGPRNPIGAAGIYLTFGGISLLGLAYWLVPLFLLRAAQANLFRGALPPGRISSMLCCLALAPIALALLQEHFPSLARPGWDAIFLYGLGGCYGNILHGQLFAPLLGQLGSALVLAIALTCALWGIFTREVSLAVAIGHRLDRLGHLGRRLAPWRSRSGNGDAQMPPAGDPIAALDSAAGPVFDGHRSESRGEIVDDALLAMKKLPVMDSLFGESSAPAEEDYVPPPLDLLDPVQSQEDASSHGALAEALKETLQQFGIAVEIGEIQSGPVLTRFELLPAPGVRVEKIENLDKNLALTLRAPSVRVLAPVPGRNCVGIEIPRAQPDPVGLRSILESEQWQRRTAEIPIVLGRGVTGEPLIADLARMPHLLIAGATGSGKTVCINSILASFLFHAAPEELRLILVDPKIVEMQVYNRLPHMLLPTLTDPKLVPNALRWLIHNMEWRYHLFAGVGVRNINGFNAKVSRSREEAEKESALDRELSPEERTAMAGLWGQRHGIAPTPRQKLPYIVCVIDELADLMLLAPDEVENSVTRLAQLARAAGIHLILATQRPSVNVITGVIKANLPSRIAFKVASKVDSRTILDANGADGLLGRGDMLFLPPGASSLVRAQGAWVSDEEVARIVEFLARRGTPNLDRQAMAFVEGAGDSGQESRRDGI
ncbi:MAG: DNA translocase FtsK 4TM domain-containing protein [Puniceicoccales bacterium]|nr:DNA translocase FtsK 4TM domain-containing protein [Puniceicoccales bacterium]